MSYVGLMDCNNFFVSCERLFRPDLWNKPVAVLSSNDGVIVARSNELKQMGVPMGMPLFQARQLVDMSEVTLFSSNFTLYRDISARVMDLLAEEVGECDVYSIDEAFFTLPSTITEAEIAEMRGRIIQNVGIPVSIGVAATKTLAKVASEIGKKGDGVSLLTDATWRHIAKDTDCSSIWGLGRATVAKLREQNITTAAQFMELDTTYVAKNFGVGGRRVQDELRGILVHEVGNDKERVQQSITSSRSFAKPTQSLTAMESAVGYHVLHVAEKLRKHNLICSRIYVEMRASRYSDFALRNGTREIVLVAPTHDTQALLHEVIVAVREMFDAEVPYKKAGITARGLLPEAYATASLFLQLQQKENVPEMNLDAITDALNEKFGQGTIRAGIVQKSGANTSAALRSHAYTTVWKDIPTVKAK